MRKLNVKIPDLEQLLRSLDAQVQGSDRPFVFEIRMACWLCGSDRGGPAVCDGRDDDLGYAAVCPSRWLEVWGRVDVLACEEDLV